MQKHSLLADLIDIQARLGQDQQIDREQLKTRDRKIGIALERHKSASLPRLRHWITTLNTKETKTTQGQLAQKSITLVTLSLWLLGMIFGWLIAQAVLHYDGSQPVNIINTILALVISQVITLILLIIFTLGGFKKLLASVSIINPANWLLSLFKKLSPSSANALNPILSGQNAKPHQSILIYLAQHFTVALNFGILAALLYLVTTTDLAFGWNTTLDISNHTMYQWFNKFSLPWNTLLSSAAPNESLVDASRFYRLQGQLHQNPAPATELGNWWLYILMAVVVYGLIPRIISLIISGYAYDRAIASTITMAPGSHQVLARMSNPLVTTLSNEQEDEESTSQSRTPLRKRQISGSLSANIIGWAFGDTTELESSEKKLKERDIIADQYFTAGGQNTLDQDRALCATLAKQNPTDLVIIVKSWEPPMLDCIDFIANMRQHLSHECAIIVLLKSLPSEEVRIEQIETWESALIPLNDTALYIEAL